MGLGRIFLSEGSLTSPSSKSSSWKQIHKTIRNITTPYSIQPTHLARTSFVKSALFAFQVDPRNWLYSITEITVEPLTVCVTVLSTFNSSHCCQHAHQCVYSSLKQNGFFRQSQLHHHNKYELKTEEHIKTKRLWSSSVKLYIRFYKSVKTLLNGLLSVLIQGINTNIPLTVLSKYTCIKSSKVIGQLAERQFHG